MRAVRGGGTVEAGRYPITILPATPREAAALRKHAGRAVRKMNPKPNLIQPFSAQEIVLSFAENIDPQHALDQFKTALRACEAEEG
jgi:hypothetical protein